MQKIFIFMITTIFLFIACGASESKLAKAIQKYQPNAKEVDVIDEMESKADTMGSRKGTTYKITARVVYTSSPKPKMMMFKVFISEDGKWSTILLAEEIK